MKTVVTLFTNLVFILIINGICFAQSSDDKHSFEWQNIPLRASLDSLMKWYSISIVYIDEDVENANASLLCKECRINEALDSLLVDMNLSWIRRGNQIIIRKVTEEDKKQYYTISGTVSDSTTGEYIAGAVIQLQNIKNESYESVLRWCQTNSYGYFSFPRIVYGEYFLIVRALGYELIKIKINCDKKVDLNVKLAQREIMMQDVTVEGNKSAFASLRRLSRGIYHKGVSTDHNQYLLDGGKIYNPTHFGGVMQTFNPQVTDDIQVAVGGLPTYYGGSVGGIIDLSLRDGWRQRHGGYLELGFLGSNFAFEGPLTDKTSFIMAGRKGYPNVGMKILPYENAKPSQLGFSELVAKATYRLSNNDRISISSYYGMDTYNNGVDDSRDKLENTFAWENSMLNMKWIGIINPSIFVNASIVYTDYSFNIKHSLNGSYVYDGIYLPSNFRVYDIGFRAQAESFYSTDHTIQAGVELTRHCINGSISEFSTQIVPVKLKVNSVLETAVYLQDQWRLTPRLQSELGGRVTNYSSEEGTFSAIDPRFSLLLLINEQTKLYSSFSTINQFIHPYRKSGVFLLYPVIFWYPSTEKIKPTTSTYLRLGLERSSINDEYILIAESYYRLINNIHQFGFDTLFIPIGTLEDIVLLGNGKTYGVTFGFRKRTGRLTGAINYNYSCSLEKYKDIDEGKEFASPFSRVHELQVSLLCSISENWTFSTFCIVSSGYSLVAPKKVILKISEENKIRYTSSEGNDCSVQGLSYKEFIDVNGNRLPGFQRLELSMSRKFSLLKQSANFTLRLVNGYGLIDPFIWNLQDNNFVGNKWSAILKKQNLFPLYPVLELSLNF